MSLYCCMQALNCFTLHRLQGYKQSSDGQIESEDMFLHRMRGIVRLYAAIVTSPLPPMDQAHSHPHGLEHGWKWLARVLNMEPHPTLTAASLGDFLEVIARVCGPIHLSIHCPYKYGYYPLL